MLSERIFFVTERISDILKLEKKLENDVKEGILNLRQKLSLILKYLKQVETTETQPLKAEFSVAISDIADSSDKILDGLCALEINNLISRIENFFQAIPSQPSYSFNTGCNINTGGQQSTGSISVSICPNKPPHISSVSRPKSYGHVQNSDIVGFNNEIKTLLDHLMRHDQTRVVGIVGMGGSGKTTLAKHLFRHPDIKKHFVQKAWVCISQSWDKREILYEIFRQTKGAPGGIKALENMSDQEIMENLSKFLSSESYLIILDDIWSMDAWYDIAPALPKRKGSKVTVTTRNQVVPQRIDPAVFILEPKQLNIEESYELLRRRTFPDDENPRNKLKSQEIAMVLERCGGLPLAIIALAGVLRADGNPNKWTTISNTLMQNIMNMEDSSTQGVVKEVLALSYHDLPHNLKLCFLYLCIFPEDHEIPAKMLIKMWIAECLVTYDSRSEEMLLAEDYLEKMIQRYIVQDVERNYMGQVKKFRIHDLIREMCVEKAKEKHFFSDSLRVAPSFIGIDGAVKSSHVRSLICFHLPKYMKLSKVDIQPMLGKFRLLRVLILSRIYTVDSELPEEIGNLIHLRYLGLAGCISELPGSVGNLQNLWILDMKRIHLFDKPPMNLWKLKNLGHLYLPYICTNVLEDLKLDRLKNLKTLWNANGGDWMLKMEGLTSTLQKLYIHTIQSEKQLEAAFGCPSMKSNNLQTMKLHWDFFDTELRGMDSLRNCTSLYNLKLWGKIRESIPMVFPPYLIKLVISYAQLKTTDLMAILGKSLPHLKILTLGRKAYLGTKLACYENFFPQLEKLKLEELGNLMLWIIKRGAMPNLNQLTIIDCPYLDFLPEGWKFISELQEVNCRHQPMQFQNNLAIWRKNDLSNSLLN